MSSHMMRGRQLSRDTEHRIAMRRNMVQSLFEHGKIRTTMPKAKEVRSMAEKLITLGRVGTLTARRRAIQILNDRRLTDADQEFTGQTVIQKLFSDIAPKFADPPGRVHAGHQDQRVPHRRRRRHRHPVAGRRNGRTDRHPPGGRPGCGGKRNERRHQFANRVLKSAKGGISPAAAAPTSDVPAVDAPAADAGQ